MLIGKVLDDSLVQVFWKEAEIPQTAQLQTKTQPIMGTPRLPNEVSMCDSQKNRSKSSVATSYGKRFKQAWSASESKRTGMSRIRKLLHHR